MFGSMEQRDLTTAPKVTTDEWTRREAVYATGLFLVSVASIAWLAWRGHTALAQHDPGATWFFLGYGLFTISIGYRHPKIGYYSFDRVSQVASILVLGPIDAAWINGLASFIYPWHRLWKGVPTRSVVLAALNNSGLMSLIVLISGSLYRALGGTTPLLSMSGSTIPALVALVLSMQLLNDVGMFVLLRLGGRDLDGFFNRFAYALELGSGATAVLVAVVYDTMEPAVFALLLGVLSIGMLALRQFANMRQRLELIVQERTRSLREKTAELEEQAIRDNLTGLFNRRYADDYLDRQIDATGRPRQPFAIALADIDLFKQINDRHSHATGDAVLRRVASILTERCRGSDVIARYGGEEFLICFPDTDLRRSFAVCEKVRAAIEDCDWSDLGLAAGVTISFGVADQRPDSTADSLLRRADLHLYAAKDKGRNLVVA